MASASNPDPQASRLASWRSTLVLVAIVLVAGSAAFAASSSRSFALIAVLVALAGAAWIVKARLIDHQRHPNYDKLLELSMAGIFIALMINIVTNVVQREWIDREPPKADALYRNHDLARLSGTVIKAILEQTVADAERGAAALPDDQRERDGLLRMAKRVLDNVKPQPDEDRRLKWEQWLESAQTEIGVAGAGIGQDALVAFVRAPHTKALTIKTWEKWLAAGASGCEIEFKTEGSVAAVRLHSEFGTVLRETLKHDYAAGGDASKAFAAMHLDVSGELLRGVSELLTQPPRLTLYHVASANDRREITPEYEGLPLDHQMRLQIDNVEQVHWRILTIDGNGEAALVQAGEMRRDADGLWTWQPTAESTETVLLLSSARDLSAEEAAALLQGIAGIPRAAGAPMLKAGQQIVWGEEAGGWKLVEAGRGLSPMAAHDDGWATQLCNLLRRIEGLRFEGRTIFVKPARTAVQ